MANTDKLSQLEAVKRQAQTCQVPPQELKPCVAAMLEQGPPGGECDPNTTGYIIATEFRRLGKSYEDIEELLLSWAQHTSNRGRALGYAEVRKIARSAYYGKHYTYGCGPGGKLYRSGYCLGHEACPYYRQLGQRRKPREDDFYDFGWPQRLGASTAGVYRAIVSLEDSRGAPGGRTLASYRELSRRSGVGISHMREKLERLQSEGLITFKPGKPRGKHGEATEIRRVIPIPEPPPRAI